MTEATFSYASSEPAMRVIECWLVQDENVNSLTDDRMATA